jgi:raffinose/stachyose/melibiose transport system substrate-binding protein
MAPGYLLSVSAAAMKDADKKKAVLDTLEYLTTDEGQTALLDCFPGVSSLRDYAQETDSISQEAGDCIRNGRIFFADYYASNALVPAWREYVTGRMTLEDFEAENDAAKPADYLGALEEEPIGTAADDFTVLDTSLYNADVMREASGADIALILNGSFYTGNLARIFKGDIRLPNRFVLKGVGAKDYLTTYGITGANLKKLMEHPVVKGAEVNALYACSGLKIKYAPWAPADANVLALTLADGSAVNDDATYTVAAWAGSIDKSYISSTIREFPEAGANMDLMTAAIKKAGSVSPARDGRVMLIWS